jgi:putative transposase
MARRRPGSRRHRRGKARLAVYQARTAAIREHHLHQISNRLIKTHDLLVIEDLHVKGMIANHYLARSASDASLGKLARML